MKKTYTKPVIERLEFDYTSVVATSETTESTSICYNRSTYENNMAASCPLKDVWTGNTAS